MPFRKATPEDHAYIADTWLREFKRSGHYGPLHEFDFYDSYRPTVNRLMNRSKVLVYTTTPETDDIDGYIVFETDVEVSTYNKFERKKQMVKLAVPVVHWLYVRGRKDCSLRNLGIGTALLTEALQPHKGCFFTFKTDKVRFFDDHFFLTYAPWYASKKRPNELPSNAAINEVREK